MWANILLIMKDLFTQHFLWVLLLCYERPLQKLNENVFRAFENHSVDVRAGGFTVLCAAIDWGFIHCSTMTRAGCTWDECGNGHADCTDKLVVQVTCNHYNTHNSFVLCCSLLR